ncbi:MAG: hypothetical protein U0Q11_00165 [Vicinamibacterales bacterium]
MGGNATMNAALRRGQRRRSLVVIGKSFVPAIGQMPNFYIAGSVLAALTRRIYALHGTGRIDGQVATGGAVAGGSSSVIGGALAVATGQWPDFQALQILLPLISGGIGGGVGGVLGRMMK